MNEALVQCEYHTSKYCKPPLEEIGSELLISSFLEISGLAPNAHFVSLSGRPWSPSKHKCSLLINPTLNKQV